MQKNLFPTPSNAFGGTLAKGRRKALRPLAKRRPMHFVLRSGKNLYRHRAELEILLRKFAAHFHHRIYGIAVAKDHVHFALLVSTRENYRHFIRALTSQLARKLGEKLWSLPPFSRVVSWGRDFENLKGYLALNRAEAAGWIPYQPRRRTKPK